MGDSDMRFALDAAAVLECLARWPTSGSVDECTEVSQRMFSKVRNFTVLVSKRFV